MTNPFDTMTPIQRLTAVLVLAITAPTEELGAKVDAMVDSFAVGLTDDEVEMAKAAAQSQTGIA